MFLQIKEKVLNEKKKKLINVSISQLFNFFFSLHLDNVHNKINNRPKLITV